MTGKILIIDHDHRCSEELARALQARGYLVASSASKEDGERSLKRFGPELVLVDPATPGMKGWSDFRRLCRAADVPCIAVTSNKTVEHRVKGLNCGADDVVNKPFSVEELELRIRAMLRRNRARTTLLPPLFDDGVLCIDLDQGTVERQGVTLKLTPTEFRLLRCLLLRKGQVVPHRHILYEVWGTGLEANSDNLAHYVHMLRTKLEQDPGRPQYIRTHWGVGYRFDHKNDSSV
jgi:two-component system KDP operon response regulator KdpE